jgi:hypothetical protein
MNRSMTIGMSILLIRIMTREHDRHQGHNNNNNYDEQVNDNWDEYSADLKLDDHDTCHPVQHICHGRDGHR